jgi:hypothetical protein
VEEESERGYGGERSWPKPRSLRARRLWIGFNFSRDSRPAGRTSVVEERIKTFQVFIRAQVGWG